MILEMRNFGQHEHLTLSAEDSEVLFVVGKNRVGKSTIRDAIEFAMLGMCQIRGFKTQKDTRAHMIRKGAPSAAVSFRWGKNGIAREISTKGGHKIKTFNDGVWQEATATELNEYLGLDAAAIRVALDFDQFYRMSQEDRRKMLIDVKDSGGVTAQDVWEALGTLLTDYATEDESRNGRLRGMCESAALEGFAKANEAAGEERRIQKRRLAEIDGKLKEDAVGPEIDGLDVTRGTPEQHRAKLAELETELEEAKVKNAQGAGEASGRIEEIQESADLLEKRIEVESNKKTSLVSGAVDGEFSLDELMAIAKAAEVDLNAIRDDLREEKEALEALKADKRELDQRIDSSKEKPEHPGMCPAMAFEMKCRVKVDTFVNAWEKQGGGDEAREAIEEKLGEIAGAISVAVDSHALLNGRVQAQEGHCTNIARSVLEARSNEASVSALKESLESMKSRLAELEGEASKTGADQGVPLEEIEAMEAKIATGHKVIQHRTAFDASKAARVALETERSAVEMDVNYWDDVEKQFKPSGIEQALAADATGRFESVLEQCDDLAEVRITPEMDISINGNVAASCSKSEQLCGGIALQAGMAQHLGLGFLVIDELDKLDAGWVSKFRSWAGGSRQEWTGGIMALATTNADPPGAPPGGFRTIWLRDGEKAVVIAGGAE